MIYIITQCVLISRNVKQIPESVHLMPLWADL